MNRPMAFRHFRISDLANHRQADVVLRRYSRSREDNSDSYCHRSPYHRISERCGHRDCVHLFQLQAKCRPAKRRQLAVESTEAAQPGTAFPTRECESSLDQHKKKRTRPSINELLRALQSVAAIFSRVFIIVDALDECQAS